MPEPPLVNVVFYENFHEIEVDVHFVGGSINGGTMTRVYHVHEVISEEGGPVLEEKDYTEERPAIYEKIIVHCEASSGTFRIEFINFEGGAGEERIMYSFPISYLFDAAAVRAAVPEPGENDGEGHLVDGIADDPGYLRVSRVTFAGGGSVDFPLTGVQASFHDIAPNTVEIRVFYDDGLTAGFEHHGVREHDIDLGPIWEVRKVWDEIVYNLRLEQNPACAGKGQPIPVPKGVIDAGGPRNATVVSRTKITGRTGSIPS